MNPFEQYTLMIGLLAVLIEGYSYVRDLLHKAFHRSHPKHTGKDGI
jgi:hypothetical protein